MNNFPAHNHNAYSGVHLFNETSITLPIDEEDIIKIVEIIQKNDLIEIKLAEVVFVDEAEILRINRKHLSHDYITDVITFSYSKSAEGENIEGTLYCCAPQIKKQAEENNQSIKKEFLHIVIHGLLHLCCYDDKTDFDRKQMRKREDFYLSKLSLT